MFNGLGMNLSNLSYLSKAKTRSISPENFTGEKGRAAMAEEGTGAMAARELGVGWKISPSIRIKCGETFELANISGSGAIQHIWMTPSGTYRQNILRIYWDGSDTPSVEVPLGDFFASAFEGQYGQISSIPVCVNPARAFNCYWEMPFRKNARITVENISPKEMTLYYQIDYCLTDVPDDCAYFHAQFRRVNPLPYATVYTILDGVQGQGQYVGTYMTYSLTNNNWWGEGEIKFYLDGDKDYPTIAGTGTEDYFCGSYNFDVAGKYTEFTTPYCGMPLVISPDGLYKSQHRFSLYRWHITDPIRFEEDIKVTMQALGWRSEGRYLPLQCDISSVAYWYQTLPHAEFPELPDANGLEII